MRQQHKSGIAEFLPFGFSLDVRKTPIMFPDEYQDMYCNYYE